MRGKRQKIQYTQLRLAFVEESRGETLGADAQGTEPLTAKRNPESPAGKERLMEEVCERRPRMLSFSLEHSILVVVEYKSPIRLIFLAEFPNAKNGFSSNVKTTRSEEGPSPVNERSSESIFA